MKDETEQQPESLLPYDQWAEDALRQVVVRDLQYASANCLPGEHHFYITFRTDHPGVVIPPRLRSQYPQEMTIVLQHQFWDLGVDEEAQLITVGLSFGGIGATLAIPLAAVIGFDDPHIRFALRFRTPPQPEPEAEPEPTPEPESEPQAAGDEPAPQPQVVSLDAFRRRGPSKDS